MDLAAICEVLQATQVPDEAIRKAAEEKLEGAKKNNLNELVQALVMVLAAAGNVAPEIRQQAAVLLRQRVRESWDDFQMDTCKGLKTQILATVETDPSVPVRRNTGNVVSAVAQEGCDDVERLMQHWPELLPWLATQSANGEGQCRTIALGILKELVPGIGEDMLAKGDQVKDMLSKALSDPSAEIRAAGVQLVFAFIQHLDDDSHQKLVAGMPAVTSVLQGLATGSTEKELEETLGCLVLATEEEPTFFFENNFEPLWQTLTTICDAGAATFGTAEIRHVAMESMMTIAEGNNDEDLFKQHLEGLVTINFKWMSQEVEKDVAAWTAEGKDNGEDGEIDDAVVHIGEENFDRLATSFDEEDLMPIIFKVIAASTGSTDWSDLRSAIMALSQVVEHLEDEARVDQSIDFIMRHFEHPHPRVRYVAFTAIAQCTFDQEERIHEKYAGHLLPKILKGMQDDNIRVVTAAVEAFGALGSELDADDVELENHMEELLLLLFKHLDAGESRHLQEQCIDCIGLAARAAEEQFKNYYGQVMPLLKQVIAAATKEDQRTLRGKAFLCTSEVGSVVGKEIFAKDACEVMDIILPLFQAGFAADDKTRELAHEACGNIARTIGKDFKGYVGALLPTILQVLNQKPKDVADLLDEDDDLDDIILNELGAMGLKTSVLEEMDDALELVIILATSLEEEFCGFIGASCEALLPLLDYPVSEDVRETIYRAWGKLASLARSGIEKGRLEPNVLQGIVTEFLKKSVGTLGQGNPEDVCENNVTTCAKFQTLAQGASDVILKAGTGVLSREAMKDICTVIGQLLTKIDCSNITVADGKRRKKRDPETIDDDDEPDEDDAKEEDEATPTPQTVRFALADVMCALMQTNTAEFAEDVMPTFMGQLVNHLVQDNMCDADRTLAFYIADQVTDFMGETSVKYWQVFMNHALVAILHRSPMVQQYAAKVVGTGAKQNQYSIMALAACQNVFQVVQKHGEKHRRRRAKGDQKPTALAIDACVRALGLICEHQEAQLGQHAPQIWSMWISSLPVKYDVEKGQQVHAQLLSLLTREHPVLVDQAKLPTVLRVLTDVYRTKLSVPELDKNIALALSHLGRERLEVLCTDFKEGQKKKLEHMLKHAAAAASA